MSLNAENIFVLAKNEAVYGTPEVMVGADAVQSAIQLIPFNATRKERRFSSAVHGAVPVIHTEVHRGINLSNIELAGSGDPAVAPAWVPIMRGCGWAATVGPTETELLPVTDAVDSLTLDTYLDGERFQLVGSRGSISGAFQVGEFPTLSANILGGYVAPTTVVTPPVEDYSDWQIPHPVNCEQTQALDIDGTDYPFFEFTFNQNAQLEFLCIPGETGSRIEIQQRNITGRVRLQAKKVSDHDLFALVRSNARVPISFIHGVTAGAIIECGGPKVQLLNPTPGNYKGELSYDCDVIFTRDTGDDEFYLKAR